MHPRIGAYLLLLTGLISLAIGFATSSPPILTLVVIPAGFPWILFHRHAKEWELEAGLLLTVLVAAFGLLVGIEAGYTFFGTLTALAAWDLLHFEKRLQSVEKVLEQKTMIISHYRRLAIVLVAGLILGGLALNVQLHLGFWVSLILAGLALLGLNQALQFQRSNHD
jgi:hypothetical protein